MILGAVIATLVLAYIIVKFVPLKLRGLVSIVLLAISAFLVFKIYEGVMVPIKFDKEKKVRYAKVIKNLKLIRNAEQKYKEVKGVYTKDKVALIKFIETDSLALTETKSVEKSVHIGGGITKEISVKKVDTIGYEKIASYFKDIDYKNMFKVPGTDKEFTIEVGQVEKVAGLMVPVFEAKIDKKSVLKGMNEMMIMQEIEALETDQIKGANVSVGSLEEITVGGNWPPFYEKQE